MNNDSKVKMIKAYKLFSLIVLACFIISSFCFFIGQLWIPLGFIIGYIFSSINMLFLYKFSYYLTRPHANYRKLNFFSYIVRLLMYGIGFAICIVLDYFGYKIFFYGTCLASYLLSIVSIVIIFRK